MRTRLEIDIYFLKKTSRTTRWCRHANVWIMFRFNCILLLKKMVILMNARTVKPKWTSIGEPQNSCEKIITGDRGVSFVSFLPTTGYVTYFSIIIPLIFLEGTGFESRPCQVYAEYECLKSAGSESTCGAENISPCVGVTMGWKKPGDCSSPHQIHAQIVRWQKRRQNQSAVLFAPCSHAQHACYGEREVWRLCTSFHLDHLFC